MKHTKIIALIMVAAMLFLTLVSCNSSNSEPKATETDKVTETPTEVPTEKPTDAPDTTEDGKIVMYADGEYLANLIRKDIVDDTDQSLYNTLRNALKDVVGKTPSIKTDFEESTRASAGIVLGNTACEESAQLYAELETTGAVARVIGNKYVLAYTSSKAGIKLIDKVVALIKANEGKSEIVIDETWNITLSSLEILGYDESLLDSYIELPKFNGKVFDSADIDVGHGSRLYIAEDATLDDFEKYAASLDQAGFTFYTENQIGDNHFYTFITAAQIVTVMYMSGFEEVRVTIDNRGEFDLPALETANEYVTVTEPSYTVIANGQTGYPGGMGYVYKLSDGTFFIVDGGITNEGSGNRGIWKWMLNTLKSLADDPDNIVISGWLLTHIHNDHMGGFMDMSQYEECLEAITIKQVIYNQPSDDWMNTAGITHRINWVPDSIDRWKPETVVKAHPGQEFFFADLKLTILATQDIVIPASMKSHNNACVVSSVEFQGKSALYLADSEGNENASLVKNYGDNLKTDILQLSHHGYNNTDADALYEIASPTIVLWPVSTAHYDTPGQAMVSAVGFNQRFFKDGIVNHVAREENMTIKNFATWEPEPRWTANEVVEGLN